jgi:hypothetical protein
LLGTTVARGASVIGVASLGWAILSTAVDIERFLISRRRG